MIVRVVYNHFIVVFFYIWLLFPALSLCLFWIWHAPKTIFLVFFFRASISQNLQKHNNIFFHCIFFIYLVYPASHGLSCLEVPVVFIHSPKYGGVKMWYVGLICVSAGPGCAPMGLLLRPVLRNCQPHRTADHCDVSFTLWLPREHRRSPNRVTHPNDKGANKQNGNDNRFNIQYI